MDTPSSSYSFTVRIKSENRPGMVGQITSVIGESGGDIGAIDIVSAKKNDVTRDYTVNAGNVAHSHEIVEELKVIDGLEVLSVSDRTFLIHLGGKITIESKRALNTRDDLSMAYTPGVARVCLEIAEDKAKAYNLTIKKNTIAIVTDGSAVLGLGDIGPEASLPVMEGKSMLFKKFGGVNAFPICLDTKDSEEIIDTVVRIAPVFGGINLEDISAPRCFHIERELARRLDIPVFHDDQHGTAVVVMAGIINSLKVVDKKIEDVKIVISGLGAAGVACARLLAHAGAKNIIGVDSAGALYKGRTENMNKEKVSLAEIINPDKVSGQLETVIEGADIFIGVSAPNILDEEGVKKMASDAIVFALSNPDPEIDPAIAEPHVRVMATGRSDYQNQVNNVLCFPGFFKGLLVVNASEINRDMKLAAARAIAEVITDDELSEEYIIPSVFDARVPPLVATAVVDAAVETGVARRVTKREIEEE
ncbi:MAG: NAD-dependent malic enzyme [Proteobacteria bacterium]|nr:NAD-dependent malic enzyme [Pseudomonadota bacterium]